VTVPSRIDGILAGLDLEATGRAMHAFMARAFPICRSITGDGVRQTLALARERSPIELQEVPTGTPVLDWTIPREWNVREAWIKGPDGRKLVDFAASNLHLVSYSVPVRARLSLAELLPHLHSLPDEPELVPYRTSYYREDWGFCLPHRILAALPQGEYEVVVDSTLEAGSLSYGELLLPGQSEQEVLVSCHVCHPSLANDNLSGLAVTLWLAELVAPLPRRYSYRFLWIPGTIGSIAWLAANEDTVTRLAHGLVAANLGDPGRFTYKRSRRGDAEIDRVVAHVLSASGREHEIQDFVPFGYDERQYCSPGFNLPVGSLTRTPWGRYREYHTSADDLDFVRPAALAESLATYLRVIAVLEGNRRYLNLNPRGEPQLGRRGLYRPLGGEASRDRELALLWVLSLSDGNSDLLDVALRSRLPFSTIEAAAQALLAAGLVREDEP
jgi:aminopeptidase-like protein